MNNRFISLVILLLIYSIPCISQAAAKYYPMDIPVRDGKTLAADLYSIDTTVKKAVVLIQTPYNKNFYRLSVNLPPQAGGASFPYDSISYNYVILDWRGFYGSKNADVANYDRGLDGYDAVEWIANQKWCNGKIGTWGPSALGMIQYQTAKHHPPHLVCAVPLVKDFKTKYSDYYYGGDFRKEHVESLVKLGFFASTDIITNHPDQDIFWSLIEKSTDYPDSISIPMLVIGGWFDHFPDDVLRSFDDLRKRSDLNVRTQHKLMIGPWLHSGIDKANQGELDYPNAADAANDRALQFYAYYLQGAKNGYPLLPAVQYYQLGTNEWHTTNDWYTLSDRKLTFYLQSGGGLISTLPSQVNSADSLMYDPRNPSPAVGGSRFNPFDKTIPTGPVDIRQEVESRSDALIFSTDSLSSDLILDGPVTIELFVSSDRKDTDFSVRLCDVYPDGRSLIMTQGIRRARFRNAYNKEELLNPGQIYPLTIELQNIGLTIMKNHRLRIVISSSDYPHFDINLNNGDALYKPGDTLIATNYIYHDAAHPSRVVLSTGAIDQVNNPIKPEGKDIYLSQNNPNPCTLHTTFRFRINSDQYRSTLVKLKLFDVLGREVVTLLNEELYAGEYTIPFNTKMIPGGVYFYQLTSGKSSVVKSMIVTK